MSRFIDTYYVKIIWWSYYILIWFDWFIQCRNVVWLPGSVSEASVTENTCITCSPGYFSEFFFSRTGLGILIQYIFFHIWFPDFWIWLSGPVFKIQFKFRQQEIPPDYSVQHLGMLENRTVLWYNLSLTEKPYPFLFSNGTLNC